MKPSILITFLLFLSILVSAQDQNWELREVKEDITVYTCKVEGSEMDEFKGIMTVEAKLSTIVSAIRDIDNFANWVYMAESAKILKEDESTVYTYVVTEAPWPVKRRDAIYLNRLYQNPKNKEVMITMIGDAKYIPENKDCVRIPDAKGFWLLTPIDSTKVRVIFQMHASPGGSIPAWLANLTAIDSPFVTMKNLRNEIIKPKYQSVAINGVVDYE